MIEYHNQKNNCISLIIYKWLSAANLHVAYSVSTLLGSYQNMTIDSYNSRYQGFNTVIFKTFNTFLTVYYIGGGGNYIWT